MRMKAKSSGKMLILSTLSKRFAQPFGEADASSFWTSKVNKTRIPINPTEPAIPIAEMVVMVDVVIVEIIFLP